MQVRDMEDAHQLDSGLQLEALQDVQEGQQPLFLCPGSAQLSPVSSSGRGVTAACPEVTVRVERLGLPPLDLFYCRASSDAKDEGLLCVSGLLLDVEFGVGPVQVAVEYRRFAVSFGGGPTSTEEEATLAAALQLLLLRRPDSPLLSPTHVALAVLQQLQPALLQLRATPEANENVFTTEQGWPLTCVDYGDMNQLFEVAPGVICAQGLLLCLSLSHEVAVFCRSSGEGSFTAWLAGIEPPLVCVCVCVFFHVDVGTGPLQYTALGAAPRQSAGRPGRGCQRLVPL